MSLPGDSQVEGSPSQTQDRSSVRRSVTFDNGEDGTHSRDGGCREHMGLLRSSTSIPTFVGHIPRANNRSSSFSASTSPGQYGSVGNSWRRESRMDRASGKSNESTPTKNWACFTSMLDEDDEGEDGKRPAPPLGFMASVLGSPTSGASRSNVTKRLRSLTGQSDAQNGLTGEPLTAEPSSYAPDAAAESDSDDERDDDDEFKHRRQSSQNKERSFWTKANPLSRLPELTSVQKNILKCSIAYFISSLFTFVPFLAERLAQPFDLDGPVANAHMIATISTYFNPAKTKGSMIEANIFALWATIFSLFICFSSMGTAVFLNLHDLEILSHTIAVVVWLGGSMAFVAWMKLRVGKATFNSACSMCCLINSVIICKEGAVHLGVFETDRIVQTVVVVIIGTVISNVVCLTIWPGSATSKLQGDINKTLTSFATLLDMLAMTFLMDEGTASNKESLRKAIDAHQASFTALKTSLDEAKLELFDPRITRTSETYDRVVGSMTRLAQHLTGLRSGCGLQQDLLEARRQGLLDRLRSEQGLTGSQDPPEEMRKAFVPCKAQADIADWPAPPNLPSRIEVKATVFQAFQESVGPSLRSLAGTCRHTLRQLRTSFLQSRAGQRTRQTIRNSDDEPGLRIETLNALKDALRSSLKSFEVSHTRALKRLYRHFPSDTTDRMASPQATPQKGAQDDFNLPAFDPRPNEEVFLIYFWLFNLEEFARELIYLVDAFVEIRKQEDSIEKEKQNRKKRWGFLAPLVSWFSWGSDTDSGRSLRAVKKRLSFLVPDVNSHDKGPFPRSFETKLTSNILDDSLDFWGQVKRRLWLFGQTLQQPDFKFALKTGLACAVLGAPAFIPTLRPKWIEYRFEWAIISFMVVVSYTVGQTNFNAFFRVAGTIFGAVVAVVVYLLFSNYWLALAICGFFFSIPCFWVIVTKPKYATAGRFVLLTYNLTALYAFNLREKDVAVWSIAKHRSIAVIVGVVWGLFVTRYVWPFEARKELRKGLSEILLNAAFLYEKLVSSYSTPPASLANAHLKAGSPDPDEQTSLLTPAAQEHISISVKEFMAMELHLQVALIKLDGLLSQSVHEPRLKGPFPVATYRAILQNCQTILDQLHSMRSVTTREAWYTSVRKDFIIPVNKERREMVGNVLLYFCLLASTVSLASPLPAYLPPAEESRVRLVERIRELPAVKRRAVRGGTSYLLYFAYVLMMEDVIKQLNRLGGSFQKLFGVIGGRTREEFEAQFDDAFDDAESKEGSDSDSDTEHHDHNSRVGIFR